MHPRRPLRMMALGATLALSSEGFAADAARDAATSFYRSYAKLRAEANRMTGVPDAKQLGRLAPMLSAELRRALAAAKAAQQRCAKAFPDDKPPWIEGDLFSSNFEGFTTFRAGPGKGRGRTRSVTVRFRHVEGKSRVEWSDELLLRNESGRWRVDDVAYRAKFAFSSGFGGNLRASLKKIPAC